MKKRISEVEYENYLEISFYYEKLNIKILNLKNYGMEVPERFYKYKRKLSNLICEYEEEYNV